MANATNIKQDEHDDIPNEITLPFLLFKDETLQRAEESDKILKIQVILVMNACNIHLLFFWVQYSNLQKYILTICKCPE